MWRIDTHLKNCFGYECGLRKCFKVHWWPYLSTRNTRSYYFGEHFSFVESFQTRSSNIWNDVIWMKCWIKQEVNQSSMNIVLDEPENVRWKICSRSNFHPTRFFFIQHDFFFFCYFSVLLNRSNISSNMKFLLCWMKCWIGLTMPVCFQRVFKKHFKKK